MIFKQNDIVTVYDMTDRDWTEEDEARRAAGADWLAMDFIHRMGGVPLVIIEIMSPYVLCRYVDSDEMVVLDVRMVSIRRVPHQWWRHFCKEKPKSQARVTHEPSCGNCGAFPH